MTTTITTDRLLPRRAGLCRSRRALAVLVALGACGPTGLARAEVLVEGTPAAVRVTADQAAISDVLAAVATDFNAKNRSANPPHPPARPAHAGPVPPGLPRLPAR